MFFFEKKNQKTFIPGAAEQVKLREDKSLFAAFSSEKEDSF
jgi:hypothetical protein